jgi:hypothetical protein
MPTNTAGISNAAMILRDSFMKDLPDFRYFSLKVKQPLKLFGYFCRLYNR